MGKMLQDIRADTALFIRTVFYGGSVQTAGIRSFFAGQSCGDCKKKLFLAEKMAVINGM